MMSRKAKEVLSSLTKQEIEAVKKMNIFGKHAFITERYGNESERFGISFGLFPLWVKEVIDEIEKEER